MNLTSTLIEMLQDEKYRRLGVKLNPPAPLAEVEYLEKIIERVLPSDLRDFYLSVNGFETDDEMFRVLPVHEVIEYKNYLHAPRINFAEFMIFGDTWDLILDSDRNDHYAIVNRDPEKERDVILTNSIYEFLERYLENGGTRGEFGLISWCDRLKSRHKNESGFTE